jgi:protein-tyrosine phosphatase
VDFQTPSTAFDQSWAKDAPAVCAHLSNGGNVVVHCRGGRGRSGLVAGRLLVELGVPNAEAFAALRAVQPYAMETAVQEEHVRTFKPALGLR